MQVIKIINMLSYSDLRIGTLMALITTIIIVNDVSCEPFSILPLVVSHITGCQITVRFIEYLRRRDY